MPTTQIGAQAIYYDEYGAGQPLILIPGLGGSRLGWAKQLEPFAQKYRVINLDNRDAGDSAQSANAYPIGEMADDVAGVIENLNLGAAFVVGVSMGGFIAQHLTLRHPARVKKLVLVATSAGGAGHVNPKPEIAATLVRDPNEDIETRVRRSYAVITGPGFADAHPEDVARAIEHGYRFQMSPEAYQRQLNAAISHTRGGTRARLAEIRVPTLVIHGDCDPLVPYPNGQALAAGIPGAKFLTFPGVGHLPHIEATDEFNRAVMEFWG
ncbi:MAG: alpha/beta fold hydrolase [Chloroflexi bacterium]|nr:alpha/beta fold hydrolase [Chloroflexota bacterium]